MARMTKQVSEERLKVIQELFNQGPVTTEQLRKLTGLTVSGTQSLILELTYSLPIWSPKYGVYKLLTKEDMDNAKNFK